MGIIGGILMFDPINAKVLFSLKSTAKAMTIKVWKPQKGAIPQKTPKAREKAFVCSGKLISKISSLMNCLIFFF